MCVCVCVCVTPHSTIISIKDKQSLVYRYQNNVLRCFNICIWSFGLTLIYCVVLKTILTIWYVFILCYYNNHTVCQVSCTCLQCKHCCTRIIRAYCIWIKFIFIYIIIHIQWSVIINCQQRNSGSDYTLHTPFFILHTSLLKKLYSVYWRQWKVTVQTSYFKVHTSNFIPHTIQLTLHSSYFTRHTYSDKLHHQIEGIIDCSQNIKTTFHSSDFTLSTSQFPSLNTWLWRITDVVTFKRNWYQIFTYKRNWY